MMKTFADLAGELTTELIDSYNGKSRMITTLARQARDDEGNIVTVGMLVFSSHAAKCGIGPAFQCLMEYYLLLAVRKFKEDGNNDIELTIEASGRAAKNPGS